MRDTPLTFTKPNRYGASKITIVDDIATIKIDVNKSGLIGCRMVGSGLDLLVEGCGGVDRIPDCIQFSSDTHKFAERARDTVNLLSDTSKRREFMRNYSYRHVPVRHGEKWREYENRAPKVAKEGYSEYSWLDRTSIRVGGSQGFPDAIFVHDGTKRLVILEAKMRAKSFVEGTAQLMQYSMKATELFCGFEITPLLVTCSAVETADFKMWLNFMSLDRDLHIQII